MMTIVFILALKLLETRPPTLGPVRCYMSGDFFSSTVTAKGTKTNSPTMQLNFLGLAAHNIPQNLKQGSTLQTL